MDAHVFIGTAARRLGGTFLVMSLMVSAAQAAHGRITFSGAITAPTCASAVQSVEQAMQARAQAAAGNAVEHGHCLDAHTRTAGEARAFDLRVTRLPGAMVDTRASEYFQGFADATSTLLATQTYR